MAERRKVLIDLIVRTGGAKKGVVDLQRNLRRLDDGSGKARKGLRGLNKNAESAKRGLQGAAGGMAGMGLAAGAAGASILVVGAIIKGSVGAFASFDDKMNQSVAIMGNVSDAMRTDMSNAAREMAKTTRFSADEAAESYFFLASAGLDAKQSIAALPAVAKFGQAGMFDMALATDLLTDAQSSLGLTVDDSAENLKNMTRVSDVFVKANTLANTSVQQVSEAITNKLGGALRAYNIEIEEGVAVLAAYADQGLKGAAAGEAMNIMLRDLKKVGTQSAAVLAENNIQIFDSQGNFRNMADIIDDLSGAFDGLSVAEQTRLAADIGFQDRSFKNIQLLFGMGSAVRSYEKDLKKAGGTTEEVAGKQMESFAAQMDVVGSKLKDVGISLGEQLAPSILEAATALAGMVETLAPAIVGLGKLVALSVKFSPLAGLSKVFGFFRSKLDETFAASQRVKGAMDEMNQSIEDGKQPAGAAAEALQTLMRSGDLTVETLQAVANASGVTTEAFDMAARETLELARANDETGTAVTALAVAVLGSINASEMDAVAKRELKIELDLLGLEYRDAGVRGQFFTDATAAAAEAAGDLGDEADGTTGEILSLAGALDEATESQISLADAMREFTDPLFDAASAMADLVEAEAALVEMSANAEASLNDIAEAELGVLDATLRTQGALDALDASGLEGQIRIVQDVLGKSREEALLFLEALNLLDGTQVGVDVNTVFTASGSPIALSAVRSRNEIQFREHGGPVQAGKPFVVGEAGPELFVPRSAGMIIPNMPDQTSPVTNNRGGDTFIIHGDELPESIRLAGTLAGITRRMETKVGK